MAEYNPSKIIKDGNTYNFRDTTKIPLSGSNAISGDLIPSTDNSIDIGSSTSNIKMIYTKGININGTQFLPSDYAALSSLATVATSGSYADLSNKPSIPVIDSALSSTSTNGLQNKVINSALDGKANSTHTHSASDITSGLASVAISGSYNDLNNKPTIPTVNDGTLTIKVNGITAGTFTANQATNEEINITAGGAEYASEAEVTEVLSEMNYLL